MYRPKLLLIDGNNMAHRVFWSRRKRRPDGKSAGSLSHKGQEVDMLFGFFRQLIHLHKKYPDFARVICWDRGYERRLRESEEGVKAGLIPSAYKQPRKEAQDEKDAADDPDRISFKEQMQELIPALDLVRCIQVAVDGVEADDLIYTYSRHYADFDAECVVVSTDNDFMQVLDGTTKVYDAMNKELWTAERFEMEFGFPAHLWVDAGAIMGDKSDNIFGVDGWGPKTACKYVGEFGNIESIIKALEAKEKRGKKEQTFLEQLDRLALARSLKQMDVLPTVPKPTCLPKDPDKLKKFFLDWSFASLLKEVPRLV